METIVRGIKHSRKTRLTQYTIVNPKLTTTDYGLNCANACGATV